MSPELLEITLISFTTFFATMGPINVAAVYAGLTAGIPENYRRKMAYKSVLVATGILLVFALLGNDAIHYMGISLAALKTSGGILLLLIGINMVLANSTGINSTTDDEEEEAATRQDISVFPLATPLIAGAGSMGSAVLMMAKAEGNILHQTAVIGTMLVVLLMVLGALLMATKIQKLIGITGLNVVSRVVGVLLTALAVQFMFDGIADSGLLSQR